jgi:hypothetical protein
MFSHGTLLAPQVQVLKDEHGREVFGSDRSAVMAMFPNEGGVVSGYTDACRLRELRHSNESKVQVLHARAAAGGHKQSSTLNWSRIQAEVANTREFRDLVDEYDRLKARATDDQLSDETRSHRAMASHGAAHCAMSFMPRASHPSDKRGREVSGRKLGDAVTAFLDEGGEMSIDAHGGCSLHGCSLLQLRRYNELQLQHHHQHQQGLSRPSEPGRWQPTHMRCGAFFVPVCEHCYHEDCEGECLEDDPCLHGW